MKLQYVAMVLLLISSPAWADRKEADACAASLSPESKAVYDAVVVKAKPGADNKSIAEGVVKGMVADGKLSLFSAKSTAEPAGECIKKLDH
jgi:hypothetical protein